MAYLDYFLFSIKKGVNILNEIGEELQYARESSGVSLNEKELIDEFNEYMFEYTSKIPIKDIEKTIELKLKEEDNTKKIASPYTKQAKKYNKWVYVAIYVFILLLVLVAIIWSVKQVTINRNVTDTISYGK